MNNNWIKEHRDKEHYISVKRADTEYNRAVRSTGSGSQDTKKARENLRKVNIREYGIDLGPSGL